MSGETPQAAIHNLRLKNAEQRVLIAKLQKRIAEQDGLKNILIEENARLNKLREYDL